MKVFLALSVFIFVHVSSFAAAPHDYYPSHILNLSQNELKEELFRTISINHRSFSYREARIKLFNFIHLERDQSGYFIEGVYCLKKLYIGGNHPGRHIPDHTILNTEHTWPQSKFSGRFRRLVQKTDLHHLYPTFSKINSQRGNLPFADVISGRELFCNQSQSGQPADNGSGIYFEPPEEHKGNVARAIFYFSIRYQITIDPIQEYYLKIWHYLDPADREEEKRNDKVFSFQRNRNPFIDLPGLVSEIDDF
jgi:deoxyribonuclease-1